jgi:ribosomal protein S27AE
MKTSGKCPKCGGTHIIADAKVVDRAHYNREDELKVATFSKPDAFLFKGQHSSKVSAWVCGTCGFVELYADAPKTLL